MLAVERGDQVLGERLLVGRRPVGQVLRQIVAQVAVVVAGHGVALVGREATVVTNLAGEHQVLDGLIRQLAVDHESAALGAAVVIVAAIVG